MQLQADCFRAVVFSIQSVAAWWSALFCCAPPTPHLHLSSIRPKPHQYPHPQPNPLAFCNPDTSVPLTINKDGVWQQLSPRGKPFARLPRGGPGGDLCGIDAPSPSQLYWCWLAVIWSCALAGEALLFTYCLFVLVLLAGTGAFYFVCRIFYA